MRKRNSEKFAWKKYGVWKTQGGGNHPPSVVRGLTNENNVKKIIINNK